MLLRACRVARIRRTRQSEIGKHPMRSCGKRQLFFFVKNVFLPPFETVLSRSLLVIISMALMVVQHHRSNPHRILRDHQNPAYQLYYPFWPQPVEFLHVFCIHYFSYFVTFHIGIVHSGRCGTEPADGDGIPEYQRYGASRKAAHFGRICRGSFPVSVYKLSQLCN